MRGILPRNIFLHDLAKRTELLELRGMHYWSMSRIGRYFGCDHTTVINNLKRFAPELLKVVAVRDPIRKTYERKILVLPPTTAKYQKLLEEDCIYLLPRPKKYLQYVKENKARNADGRAALTRRLKKEFEERVARRGRIDYSSKTHKDTSYLF